MKKILATFFIVFFLVGCTINTPTSKIDQKQIDDIKQQLLNEIKEDYKESIKNELKIELAEEIKKQFKPGLSDVEDLIINVVETNKKAVLGVTNYKTILGKMQVHSTGSGVIYKKINNDYYLITNEHVVNGYEKLSVVLENNKTIDATLIGMDKMTDIAVVKFSYDKALPVAEIINSDDLVQGQFCIAIGNPLGYDYYGSVTLGIVSGVARGVEIDYDNDSIIDWKVTLIQHDASINPGNSGGPLFDIQGKVIGINNMKIVQSDVNNIGFAIPSTIVINIVNILENEGKVIRASLGIIGEEVSKMLDRNSANIPQGVTDGVFIKDIITNSSIDNSGVLVNDIIVKYNNQDIKTFDDLRDCINSSFVGDIVKITVNRNGILFAYDITLKART